MMSLIKSGRYDVRVISTALTVTKNKNPQVVVEFENDEGDTIKAFLVITDDSWEYVEPKLVNVGWIGSDRGYTLEDFNEDPCPFLGNECNIVVKDREYPEGSGKMQPQVAFINPLGGSVRNKMSEDESVSASDWLRKLVRKRGPQATTASRSAGAATKKEPPAKGKPKADDVAPWEDDQPF